jgi:ribosome maturation factor RimP
MYSEFVKETVRKEVEPILKQMGFGLVELTIARQKGATRIGIVIHRPSGVGIDECSEVSRLLFPRLETMEGLSDMSLEVSSPGIERVLKSPEEYPIFMGRGIRLLMEGETEWMGGTLEKAENGVLTIGVEGKLTELSVSSIRRARLDHRWDPPPGGTPLAGNPKSGKGSKEEYHAV